VLSVLNTRAEPDAFQILLAERSKRWYNACLRITRDPNLAADAVQSALLKAWDRRHEFRGDAALDTWIHRIALNAAIDLTRRRKRRAEDPFDPEELESDSSNSTPDRDLHREELDRDLSVAMQRLSATERQTFLLKHVEGWSLAEIAESTQTNVNNVKSTLFRAIRKLRVDLQLWKPET
jgi:RNA polymerase sigma-70 factor (ECF subfamily)